MNINIKNNKFFYVISDEEKSLTELIINSKFKHINIDGKNCKNSKSLFKEFAIKFKFPDYFGYNWNALDECINDLEWLPADGYVVEVENSDLLLVNDKNDFKILIELLYNTCVEWSNGRDYDSFTTPQTPFYVLLRSKNIKKLDDEITRVLQG
jgi:RNAse (barnase) inhibitor barstar